MLYNLVLLCVTIFSEYGEDGSGDSSGCSDSSGDEDEEGGGYQRKRRRKINGDSGLFDNDFFESEFRKRRKVVISRFCIQKLKAHCHGFC